MIGLIIIIIIAGYLIYASRATAKISWNSTNKEQIRNRLALKYPTMSVQSQDCFINIVSKKLAYVKVIDYFDIGSTDKNMIFTINNLIDNCSKDPSYIDPEIKRQSYADLLSSLPSSLSANTKENVATCILNTVNFNYANITNDIRKVCIAKFSS